MNQISSVNRYCLNVFQDKRIKFSYQKHLQKIASIVKQKSQFELIEREQKRILKAMHRSRQVSRNFKERQSKRSIQQEDEKFKHRLIAHNSLKNMGGENDIYPLEERKGNKKTEPKDTARQLQIKRQNQKIHLALVQQRKSRKKYLKEVEKNIQDYIHLRNRITKLKTVGCETQSIEKDHNRNNKSICVSGKKDKRKLKKHPRLRSYTNQNKAISAVQAYLDQNKQK